MKSKILKKLEIKKEIISLVKGGIVDPTGEDPSGGGEELRSAACTVSCNCDHTRGCPSWNVAC